MMYISFLASKDYLDLVLSLSFFVQPQERDITSKTFGDGLVPGLLQMSTCVFRTMDKSQVTLHVEMYLELLANLSLPNSSFPFTNLSSFPWTT